MQKIINLDKRTNPKDSVKNILNDEEKTFKVLNHYESILQERKSVVNETDFIA